MFGDKVKSANLVFAGWLGLCLAGPVGACIDLRDYDNAEEVDQAGVFAYMAAMSRILAESSDQRRRAVALMLSQPIYCHQEVPIDRADLFVELMASDDPVVLAVSLHGCDLPAAEGISQCDSGKILDRLAAIAPDNIWVSLQRLARGEDQEARGRKALRSQLEGNPYYRTLSAEILAQIPSLADYEKFLPDAKRLDPEAAREKLDEILPIDLPLDKLPPTLHQSLEQSLISDPLYLIRRVPTHFQLSIQTWGFYRFGMIESAICQPPADRQLCADVIELMLSDEQSIITPMVASGLARRYLDENNPVRQEAEAVRLKLDDWKAAQLEAGLVYGDCLGVVSMLYFEQLLHDKVALGEMQAFNALHDRLPHYCDNRVDLQR